MKTETQTLEQKINSILSPVRVLSVDEWEKIAAEIIKEKAKEFTRFKYSSDDEKSLTIQLISRFESLTRGKWVEEGVITRGAEPNYHVVPNEHKFYTSGNKAYCDCGLTTEYNKVWQPALLTKEILEKWFEGFENHKRDSTIIYHKKRTPAIIFHATYTQILLRAKSIELDKPTVFDLIIELDRYNRTAEKKIPVYYSINFIKELLK